MLRNFIFFAITLAGTLHSFAIDVVRSAVYIELATTATLAVGTNQFEIWLKTVGATNLQPQITRSTGSGFLVEKDKHLYLVSADHILESMNLNATITFGDRQGSAISVPLNQIAKPYPNGVWFFKHKIADAAIVPLFPTNQIADQLFDHALPFSKIHSETTLPERNLLMPLTIVGFPFGMGARPWFHPLMRDSLPASGLLELPRSDNNQLSVFYLLDNPAIEGFSGAPLFSLNGYQIGNKMLGPGGGELCFGLVHGTMFDRTGGKMALVVPSFYICQLISDYEAQLQPK